VKFFNGGMPVIAGLGDQSPLTPSSITNSSGATTFALGDQSPIIADTNYSLKTNIKNNSISSLNPSTNNQIDQNAIDSVLNAERQPIQSPIISNNSSVIGSPSNPPLNDETIDEYISKLFSLSPMILQQQIETYSVGQQAMLI